MWNFTGGKNKAKNGFVRKHFSDSDFKIPVEFGSDDFGTEVDDLLKAYIRALEDKGVSQAALDSIKKFRRLCGRSLKNYLKGIHSNAYENFEKAVKALHISKPELIKVSIPSDALLYRARENRSGDVMAKDYKDDEMFHIPLDSRRIISTQRYSFPGLPCLYLGASVYTCWVELNRPAFEDFQVAAIATTPGVAGYSLLGRMVLLSELSNSTGSWYITFLEKWSYKMPIFGLKSTFLESGILAVQRRELIIEEVHNKGNPGVKNTFDFLKMVVDSWFPNE